MMGNANPFVGIEEQGIWVSENQVPVLRAPLFPHLEEENDLTEELGLNENTKRNACTKKVTHTSQPLLLPFGDNGGFIYFVYVLFRDD